MLTPYSTHSLLSSFKSKMLCGLVTLTTSGGKFPDIIKRLQFFQASFNQEQAKKNGVIVPSPGVDTKYDTAISQIKATECELQEYLARQRKKLGCKVYTALPSPSHFIILSSHRALYTGGLVVTGTSWRFLSLCSHDTHQATMNSSHRRKDTGGQSSGNILKVGGQ